MDRDPDRVLGPRLDPELDRGPGRDQYLGRELGPDLLQFLDREQGLTVRMQHPDPSRESGKYDKSYSNPEA